MNRAQATNIRCRAVATACDVCAAPANTLNRGPQHYGHVHPPDRMPERQARQSPDGPFYIHLLSRIWPNSGEARIRCTRPPTDTEATWLPGQKKTLSRWPPLPNAWSIPRTDVCENMLDFTSSLFTRRHPSILWVTVENRRLQDKR